MKTRTLLIFLAATIASFTLIPAASASPPTGRAVPLCGSR
jgi:hypothetical protein